MRCRPPTRVAWRGVLADPRDPLEAADSHDQLRRALQELPPRQRQVVVLRHYEDLTEQQVANVMRCSIGAVKSQNAKGLAKLRRALDAAEPEGTR